MKKRILGTIIFLLIMLLGASVNAEVLKVEGYFYIKEDRYGYLVNVLKFSECDEAIKASASGSLEPSDNDDIVSFKNNGDMLECSYGLREPNKRTRYILGLDNRLTNWDNPWAGLNDKDYYFKDGIPIDGKKTFKDIYNKWYQGCVLWKNSEIEIKTFAAETGMLYMTIDFEPTIETTNVPSEFYLDFCDEKGDVKHIIHFVPNDNAKFIATKNKLQRNLKNNGNDWKTGEEHAAGLAALAEYVDKMSSAEAKKSALKSFVEKNTQISSTILVGTLVEQGKLCKGIDDNFKKSIIDMKDLIFKIMSDNEVTEEDIDKVEEVVDTYERGIKKYRSQFTSDGGSDRNGQRFSDDVISDANAYKPTDMDTNSAGKVEKITGKILGIVSNIGMVISVLMLAILGFKYMIGSVEEKAQYKEDLIPYFVGGVLLFSICTVLKVLMSLGTSINNI